MARLKLLDTAQRVSDNLLSGESRKKGANAPPSSSSPGAGAQHGTLRLFPCAGQTRAGRGKDGEGFPWVPLLQV